MGDAIAAIRSLGLIVKFKGWMFVENVMYDEQHKENQYVENRPCGR